MGVGPPGSGIVGVVEGVEDHPRQHHEQHHGDRDADAPVRVVEVALDADLGAREHDAEQEQHHHRADVHEDLRHADELGGGEDVQRGHAGEHDDEPQRGVHDVVGRHDADRGERSSPRR